MMRSSLLRTDFWLVLSSNDRFDEFDEAIEEAIEEDIKEAEGGGTIKAAVTR